MKLICIPAFNEEKNIEKIIKDCKKFVDDVIVCDDGSTDNTAALSKKQGAIVLQHEKNKGYGAAISTLFDYCRKENADVMITIDGDGQHDPNQVPSLLDAITKHNVDVAIGSRFLNDQDTPGYRKAGIKIITSATNYSTNLKVSDSQSGFRAYSSVAVKEIFPTETGMAVSTEILLKVSNKGLSLAEVPITVSYQGDTSTQNPVSHGTSVFATTMKYVSIRHPLLFYGLPGIILFFTGLGVGISFLDAYLYQQQILYGSLLGSIALILVGSVLILAAVLLYSMANMIRDKK